MEVEEFPPTVIDKENNPRNASGPTKGPFVFGSADPVEATRARKKPKKAQKTARNPLSNVTNNSTNTDKTDNNAQASWVHRIANLTQELSTQLNSVHIRKLIASW
jgi:hypothetical protein